MAEVWVAGVAAVAGAAISANAAKKGAAAQAGAANAAAAEQARQYNQSREDQLPFLQAGYGALDAQNRILAGDYSGFMASPDYLAALEAGTQQLDRGAAARGNQFGGGADADRIKFGQNLATQNLNNYWAKLAGMTGQGYQAGANLGVLGANAATNIGQSYRDAGNARASSYAGQANAYGNLLQQGAGLYGQWMTNRNQGGG